MVLEHTNTQVVVKVLLLLLVLEMALGMSARWHHQQPHDKPPRTLPLVSRCWVDC